MDNKSRCAVGGERGMFWFVPMRAGGGGKTPVVQTASSYLIPYPPPSSLLTELCAMDVAEKSQFLDSCADTSGQRCVWKLPVSLFALSLLSYILPGKQT